MNSPPHLASDDRVVLFDGVCKLCNGWCRFLIRHDAHVQFKLCSVQSPEGQDIFRWFNFPTDVFATMLYVSGNKVYTKSDAFLEIIQRLQRPWCYLKYLAIIPKPIRDWCYDRIALNRYYLFGRYDHCPLPSPGDEKHFLNP